MTEPRHIIVSSVSDCREKNGVVSFMGILRRNAAAFHAHGLQLAFANYVDFPPLSAKLPAAPVTADASTAPEAPQTRRWTSKLKQAIKSQLARRGLSAFLLMTCTLARRALIAAWKARSTEGPASVHFYQDVLCAFFGRALHRGDSRKVLLLHSGNDSLHQLFIHFHGMRGTRYEVFIRKQFDRTLRCQDAIVTLNKRYAQMMQEKFPELDIRCIYSTSPFAGSDLSSVATSGLRKVGAGINRLEILAVGSLQYIKGFDLLVGAAAALPLAERNRLHITIVGGGMEQASLQATIDKHQLHDVVTLKGESSDVGSFLARADAYILSSRDEGFPIALIEACSFGLPIISTRVGSIPEVFDDASCLFIEPQVDSIRDALLDIGRGNIDLQDMSLRSHAVFQSKLSLNAFLSAYCKLFAEVGQDHAR